MRRNMKRIARDDGRRDELVGRPYAISDSEL